MEWSDLKLEHRGAVSGSRCRCGQRLPERTPCFAFEGIPAALTGLLEGQEFCSVGCVRAYLLETMEVLEGQASPEIISDVHSVYSYLQAMLELATKPTRGT
jgi:hypothetical protein